MSLSAPSKTPGAMKLVTCRVAGPAPRTSTGRRPLRHGPGRRTPFGPGRGERHLGPPGEAKPDLGLARDVRPVGDPVENAVPAREATDRRPSTCTSSPPAKREHRHFLVAGDEVDHVHPAPGGPRAGRTNPPSPGRGPPPCPPRPGYRPASAVAPPPSARRRPRQCQALARLDAMVLSRLMSGLPPPVLGLVRVRDQDVADQGVQVGAWRR